MITELLQWCAVYMDFKTKAVYFWEKGLEVIMNWWS